MTTKDIQRPILIVSTVYWCAAVVTVGDVTFPARDTYREVEAHGGGEGTGREPWQQRTCGSVRNIQR